MGTLHDSCILSMLEKCARSRTGGEQLSPGMETVHDLWCNQWGGQIYFSNGTNHGKGVAILLKPSSDIKVLKEEKDDERRFLALVLNIQDSKFICINIYAPNEDNSSSQFFHKTQKKIKSMEIEATDNIIWGGDFNIIFEPELERKGGNKIIQLKDKSIEIVDDIVQPLDLNDSRRLKFPNSKRYTWRQKKSYYTIEIRLLVYLGHFI